MFTSETPTTTTSSRIQTILEANDGVDDTVRADRHPSESLVYFSTMFGNHQ